jgi:hypothetical protein
MVKIYVPKMGQKFFIYNVDKYQVPVQNQTFHQGRKIFGDPLVNQLGQGCTLTDNMLFLPVGRIVSAVFSPTNFSK